MSGVISDNTVTSSGVVAPLSSATLDANNPAIDTNPTDGLGTKWINTTSGEIFICTDAAADNNKWEGQTGGYIAPSRAVALGVIVSGSSGTTDLQYVEIDTLANALHFGDLTQARIANGTSNGTSQRGLFMGGNRPDPSPGADLYSNVIDYVTIDTAGNAIDFGDLSSNRAAVAAGSNGPSDRGLSTGGYQSDSSAGTKNIIEYVTISTLGNVSDFGDLIIGRYGHGTSDNGTNDRCVIWGGIGLSGSTQSINYITVSTTGNATDFGDEIWATQPASTGYNWNVNDGTSNGTLERGIHAGGDSAGSTAIIQYITISTPANAVQIGNLTDIASPGATSNGANDRACFFGIGSSPNQDTIDYMTISSSSNAADFGDMLYDTFGAATSNGMT
jgi:hypothetical protein